MMKQCTKCQIFRAETSFDLTYRKTGSEGERRKDCRYCRCARQQARYSSDEIYRQGLLEKMRQRDYRLKRYGLTQEAFDKMVLSQKGLCGICKEPPPPLNGKRDGWHVDHDHACCPANRRSCGRCVRMLLCKSCNLGIGYFDEDPLKLEAAIAYLQRWSR